MANWMNDPQAREEVEHVTEELKLPIYKASTKGKFRPWLKECWNKIEDYFLLLKKETVDLKASIKDLKSTKLDTGHLNARQTQNANSDQGTGVSTLYLHSDAEGKPGMTDGALLTLAYSPNWYYQLAGDWRTGNLFVRGSNENPSSPLPWNKVYHSGNFNPDSKLDKTGGTVAGDIHMQGSIFSKNNQKIIGSYNYGFSLYDANWIPKYLAYISTDGKISLGYSGDGLDIDVKTRLTVKGQEVALLDGTYDVQQIGGAYSGDGGKQPPSYVGSGKVRFLMTNEEVKGNGDYKDWVYMDTYAGGDVGFVTAFGIGKNAGRIRAFLMKGAKSGSTWTEKEEIYHTSNLNWGTLPGKPTIFPTNWANVADKPATFPPSSHSHDDRYYTEAETNGMLAPVYKPNNFVKTAWSGDYLAPKNNRSPLCTLPSNWEVCIVSYRWGNSNDLGYDHFCTGIITKNMKGRVYHAPGSGEWGEARFKIDPSNRFISEGANTTGDDCYILKVDYI